MVMTSIGGARVLVLSWSGLLLCATAAAPIQAADADVAAVYEKNCAPCHGASGKGDGKAAKVLKPPPADFSVSLDAMSDADVAKSIKEGGSAVGKSKMMPAFGSKLSDAEIAALVPYIRQLGK